MIRCAKCGVQTERNGARQKFCPGCQQRRKLRLNDDEGDCTNCDRERVEVASIGVAHLCIRCLMALHLAMLEEQRLFHKDCYPIT